MKRIAQVAVIGALTLGALADPNRAISATIIFAADFQHGGLTGWKPDSGEVRVITAEQESSLQLGPAASATSSFSSRGYRQLIVTLDMSEAELGPLGRCIAEFSIDAGHNWSEIARLRSGEGNQGAPLRNGARLDGVTDAGQVELRITNSALLPAARCWASHILVEATPMLPGERRSPDDGTRTALGARALQQASPNGPWPMTAFTYTGERHAPRQVFEGRLQLLTEHVGSKFLPLKDSYGYARAHRGAATHLPPFDFEFVQAGDVLLPVQRGAVASNDPSWEYILEPGRVWSEEGDGDFERASLPFTLEERNENCMHNGVLTFLFRSDGAISNVAYEIGKETCSYFQFDAWGYYSARYQPRSVAHRDAILAGYQDESTHRVPSKPMAALATDYPGADPNRFGSPAEVPADSMALYGVTLGGVHYLSGCDTRFGTYPYCDELDLPSYSLAKSLVGGLASLAMSKSYPDLLNSRVSRYVGECTRTHHWDEVTFRELLDMASGHYDSADYEVDEDAADNLSFHRLETHAARLDFACNHYPLKAAPGTVWVYHTTDSYLLGAALSAYYRSKQGPGADLFSDFWVTALWAPLHLNPAVVATLRTRDAARQPFTAYGLTLLRDDVAKLSDFIDAAHGKIDGRQILDSGLLDEAMQRVPSSRGLQADPYLRYQDGFWAWNVQTLLKCAEPTWIPFMSGFGGITVALMPNEMTYYYFSDGGVFSWSRAVVEADRIKPICRRAIAGGDAS